MMSLLERKRLQWAQERAEMESLCSPWALPPPAYNMRLCEGSRGRGRYSSSLEIRSTCPTSTQLDLLPRRQRSPSLPPILKADTAAPQPYEEAVAEAEGETSGYASEAAPAQHQSPQLWRARQECQCDEGGLPVAAWQYERRNSGSTEGKHRARDRGQEEGEGEARPKWGDRGVAVGRLWEPYDGDQRLPQTVSKGPPSWVERGLSSMDHTDSQLLLIEHMSSSCSSIDNYESKSGNRFTYLLGQNVPIESSIKAERESKRLKALELQAAIVQQLEERQLKKKEERMRRRQEEMEEEERFNKQKDLELKRLEEERKLAEEKQQKEQRRAEALRQALERAELQAKVEKENKKMKKLQENFDSMSLSSHSEIIPHASPKKYGSPYKESKVIQNIYIEQAFSPRKKVVCDNELQSVSSESNIIHNLSNPQSARLSQEENKQSQHTQQNSTPIPCGVTPEAHVSLVPMIPHDMFTPLHIAHTGGMQMAFLMPQHVYQCMHPVSMQPLYPTEIQHLQQPHRVTQLLQTDTDDSLCSNRVLTPSKYRNPNSRDVYTQTDFESEQSLKKTVEYNISASNTKSIDTLDENTDQNTSSEKLNCMQSKKDKRPASEDKYKELENRPKWGVNKPPTQYKKQSEKDVFYTQKRKLRSRKRLEEKQYTTSHSSDENRSPSPQAPISPQLQNVYQMKLDRNIIQSNESYWRRSRSKGDKLLSVGSSACVETSDITPLECDPSGIVRVCTSSNNPLRQPTGGNLPQARKLTLSQKFMNDKFGNPKIWNNEDRKQNTKKEEPNSKFSQRKYFLDTINKARKEQSKYYCESDSNSSKPIILDQLRTLKDSLRKQQQIWGKYEPIKQPSQSPNNEPDLEVE